MTLSETVRFASSETGKWLIADLVFGIKYLIHQQDNVQIASVYAGEDCVQLKGPEIIALLSNYLKLLSLCHSFSKKPFPVFLEAAGYSQEDVLHQNSEARLLKPAFTILCDRDSKCFLLLIRGTHSKKDILTVATGAVVPFHHSVIQGGELRDLVLGYAHCGMVAAARWIAKLSTPILLKALDEKPDYDVKIFGHSLGGGIAALLTYILRERKELSAASCVTFAPAACMTWELAESGKHFITTIINGSDFVPTFSAASMDYLRPEIRVGYAIHRDLKASGPAFRSRLQSMANAKARVAGALLRRISCCTQAKEEEEERAAAEEITEEEKVIAEAVESQTPISSSDVSDSLQLYPPGRIMHMVSVPCSSETGDLAEERVGIYETPRQLYSKIRLSKTMIKHHYMPKYKDMMKLVIAELKKTEE